MKTIGIAHPGYVSPVFDVARNLLSVAAKEGQRQARRGDPCADIEAAEKHIKKGGENYAIWR
jgi:hypothetical protein